MPIFSCATCRSAFGVISDLSIIAALPASDLLARIGPDRLLLGRDAPSSAMSGA
jgi:hypothetical protein